MRRTPFRLLLLLCAAALVGPVAAQAVDRSSLPLPAPKFEAVVGKPYKESKEA